jgi:hypothetical protein
MRRAVVLAGLLLAAGGAMAQQMQLAPSAAVACLSPAAAERGTPEYPFAAFKDKLPGDVRVRLRFAGPTAAPAVKLLSNDGDDSFVDAVRTHVATLRLPCHDGSAPVELDFHFAFRPDERPLAAVPVDAADAERQRQLQCISHVSGSNMPDYPLAAARKEVQARVLTELTFHAPDQPPTARFLPRIGADAVTAGSHDADLFLPTLRSWVTGYRMPCHAGQPARTRITYVFQLEGHAWGFKPGISLRELLPLVHGIRQQRLQLDTTRMQCPFELRVEYFQPNLPNLVREVGPGVAARQPLIDWLQQTQLDMPAKALDSVYADTLTLAVPCINIDLKPV